MTVKELIEQLQAMPEHATVMLRTPASAVTFKAMSLKSYHHDDFLAIIAGKDWG